LILVVSCRNGSLCVDLAEELYKRGFAVRRLPGLYDRNAQVSFRVDVSNASIISTLDTDTSISGGEISGVFVQRDLFIQEDRGGSHSYVNAEKEAATLGWIWSLRCPVINRYRPEFWFEPVGSLDYWRGHLERFGLEPERPREEGKAQSYLVCVIGSRVLWNHGVPERLRSIDNALVQFSGSVGLTYLEFCINDSVSSPRVAKVQPFPRYDGFCPANRQEIISELIFQLTTSENAALARTGSDSWF
jgi:hypothetical protein